jgi:DNA-binding response OmpR family regulator/anti-sigma regulatory factor (Ser/Thr protein kinase)
MNNLPKILIIDDDRNIRETLESLLAAEDLEIFSADDGRTGIEMAQELLPDAILLDIMMPGMDGFVACREIRSRPALAEIPIIMITALDDREARLAGLRAGADDFLTKPFDAVELQIRVRNIMRLNRYRNLLTERSRFHWVVENAEKGYVILDKRGEIQYANRRAQVYFHLPEDYIGIEFVQQVRRYYQSYLPAGRLEEPVDEVTGYLVQPESPAARAFWLRVEPIDPSLSIQGQRLLSATDATSEMSAQQDMRKIHLLVAHKLRTPVAHIYTSMRLLGETMDVLSADDIKKVAMTAWKGTERLVDSIKDIMKFIDAPVALADGQPACLSRLQGMIINAGDTLELANLTVSQPEQPAERWLRISTQALEMAIYEILDNAKKFHPDHTPHIEVFISAQESGLQVWFLDDGPGMTAGQIARTGQPYFQGEKWFTGEVPGMGLGIPLVLALVMQAGGQVRIANRDDRSGVCVELFLPASSQ